MANGIELRDIDAVISAYVANDLPNFMILAGNQPRVTYKGGNIDEGRVKLDNWLQVISNSGTAAVYSLRVYPADVVKITNATPYEASTTFMLDETKPVTKDAQGNVIIDRTTKYLPAPAAPVNTEMQQRLQKLEDQNAKLLEMLQAQKIANLEQKFEAQIAGLRNQESEKTGWDRVGDWVDKLLEKPDSIEKIAGTLRNIFTGGRNENYIVNTAGVAGTSKNTDVSNQHNEDLQQDQDEEEQEDMPVGPLHNHFIKPEEQGLTKDQKTSLMKQRMEALTDDQHDTVQDECLDSLEARIGRATMTRALLTLACMSDDELNMVLNFL